MLVSAERWMFDVHLEKKYLTGLGMIPEFLALAFNSTITNVELHRHRFFSHRDTQIELLYVIISNDMPRIVPYQVKFDEFSSRCLNLLRDT